MDSAPKWRRPPSKGRSKNDDSDSDMEEKSFDFDLAGASTPLKVNPETSTIFLSPIKKLHNLHLTASSPNSSSTMDPIAEKSKGNEADIDDFDEDYDDDYYSEAEQTILSDGSVEFKDEAESTQIIPNPVYINSKKRGMESPSDMIITPRSTSISSIPKLSGSGASGNMSLCSVSNISQFKVSFSNSDSTPCPRQPRKRLKFKEITPSSTPSNVNKRKNVLNLQNSTKASASILNQLNTIQRLPEDEDEEEDDSDSDGNVNGNGSGGSENGAGIKSDLNYYEFESMVASKTSSPIQSSTTANTSINSDSKVHVQRSSTPISQSTPANSRAPTPPIDEVSEYGESINGYRFVRSQPPPSSSVYYSYKTPENNNVYSQEMKNAYISGKAVEPRQSSDHKSGAQDKWYEIVGEFPVTSAGLMNEDDEDLHIGDKRINDPYLSGPGSKLKIDTTLSNEMDELDERRRQVREQYFNSFEAKRDIKLPLLDQFQLTSEITTRKEDLLALLDDKKSVLDFYQFIEGNDVLDLVRRERLKWHPDKWRHSEKWEHGNNKWVTDQDIIENLSKALNLLVERLSS
ncbi:hypothetical protein CLIB1423_08S03730 [[Candida] railenensis]|uniref:Uncharacterized protein n=1 Tax=[Candida] railenensis TaxID=45579 RepID=A0A9P0VYE4_9ASCO|nr:hypothetical protein CLIB1423_08S03730 [[Candida] railenensis]